MGKGNCCIEKITSTNPLRIKEGTLMANETRENCLHIKIGDRADAVLELIATNLGKSKLELAATLLQRALLGEGHTYIVAAKKAQRSGLLDN
jgi:hypothetical protein